MSQDTSPEAYSEYLTKYRLFKRQWPRLAGRAKTYEEWTEAMQHRDHPRWSEYVIARRLWKASTFHITYGPHAGREDTLPAFPPFEKWLEHHADQDQP